MSENPVHKNREKFNRPSTHKDKKKSVKKGERKHKKDEIPDAPKFGVIDGDLALFPAASSAETTWYIYSDKNGNEVCRFDSAQAGKNWIEAIEFMGEDIDYNYQGNVDDLTRSVVYEVGEIETAKKNFKSIIKRWAKQARVDDYVVYVSKGSGLENFRYGVAMRKPYKGNRAGSHKPALLEPLRKWATSLPYVKRASGGYETDDVVCAVAQKRGKNAVLIQNEKDGLQVTGCWVLFPDLHDKPVWSTPETVGYIEKYKDKVIGLGHLFLLSQCVSGDSADFYSGLDGAGNAKALSTLSPFNNKPISYLKESVWAVCDLYYKKYGEQYKYVNKDGKKCIASWKDFMLESLNLAYMRKNKKDTPKMYEKMIDGWEKPLDSQAA